MKNKLAIITINMLLVMVYAQAQTVIPVWPKAAPGSENETQKETEFNGPPINTRLLRNITHPTLTVFPPAAGKANGTAMIVCPGGGFQFLSIDMEGMEVAKWLSAHGVTAFVLKYRTARTPDSDSEFQQFVTEMVSGKGRPLTPNEVLETSNRAIADGQQAMKLVRQRANEFSINTNRVGIIGFSAGASVAMGVVLSREAESHPDFAALIYGGSLGDSQVPINAPPVFILCASDDNSKAIGSAKLYNQWREANHSAELHLYSKGGHGFGMKKQALPVDSWVERLGDWLDVQGLLK